MRKKFKKPKIWDAIEKAALSLKIPENTIAQWRSRNYVPPAMHYALVSQAEKLELKLTHKDLHRQWKSERLI